MCVLEDIRRGKAASVGIVGATAARSIWVSREVASPAIFTPLTETALLERASPVCEDCEPNSRSPAYWHQRGHRKEFAGPRRATVSPWTWRSSTNLELGHDCMDANDTFDCRFAAYLVANGFCSPAVLAATAGQPTSDL